MLEERTIDPSAIFRKTGGPRDLAKPFVPGDRIFFAHGDDRCAPLYGLGVQPGYFGQHLLGGNANCMQGEEPEGSSRRPMGAHSAVL